MKVYVIRNFSSKHTCQVVTMTTYFENSYLDSELLFIFSLFLLFFEKNVFVEYFSGSYKGEGSQLNIAREKKSLLKLYRFLRHNEA